jgi:Putative auto-transporter adhesin, head GIN domain
MRGPALVTAILLLGACHVGDGPSHDGESHGTASRDYRVGPFDRISLAGADDVIVAVGGAPSVRAQGDDEELDRMEIGVANGELRISRRGQGGWSWFGGHHRGVTVHVTVPALTAAAIRGSGDMRIDRIEGPAFAATITGSGDMDIGAARIGAASLSITGSGAIRASGSAQRASIAVTGSGDANLAALEIGDATIAVAGSGDVTARATGTAQVELRGSGDVTVTGGARCTVSKTGSGDVDCG